MRRLAPERPDPAAASALIDVLPLVEVDEEALLDPSFRRCSRPCASKESTTTKRCGSR